MPTYKIECNLEHEFKQQQTVIVEIVADNMAAALEQALGDAHKKARPSAWDATYNDTCVESYYVIDHDNKNETAARCRKTPDMFPEQKRSFTVRATEKQLMAAIKGQQS